MSNPQGIIDEYLTIKLNVNLAWQVDKQEDLGYVMDFKSETILR